jgi:glutamate/tyrosine decarboxylase-like PLP-dependent enzyme
LHIQIAGIATANFRPLPTDASNHFSLSLAVLIKAATTDVAAGLVSFFLYGKVGTTSSSVVDPLLELGDIAKVYVLTFS